MIINIPTTKYECKIKITELNTLVLITSNYNGRGSVHTLICEVIHGNNFLLCSEMWKQIANKSDSLIFKYEK